MAFLRFPVASERCEPRKCHSLWNSECCVVDLVGHSLWLPSSHISIGNVVDEKKVVRRHVVRCYEIRIGWREEKITKGVPFPSSTSLGRGNNSPLKCARVFGLEEAGACASQPELLENCETGELDNVASDAKSLTLKKAISKKFLNCNLRRKSEGKRWNNLSGTKKEVGGEVAFAVSSKNVKSKYVRKNSGLKSTLSAVGPEASVEHCNAILKLCEQSSDEKTLNFFEWMRKNGKLKGNCTAYSLALRALTRKGDWSASKVLLEEMTTSSGCELNSQVLNTFIYVCAKRGNVEMGTKWFHMMLERGIQPNISTFGMLMGLYQKGGNLSEAEFTFGQMRSCRVHCVTAYSAMITICTRLGLYDKSEEIIGIMKEEEVQPNLENWLVRLNTYSQQGKLEEAESVLKSMLEAGNSPNIVAYNTLITGYGKVADTKVAQHLFKSLKGIGLEPDETTFRSMVEGFGRTDNYKEAKRYYDKLKNSGFCPNSSNFYTMINLQARHEDEDGAIQTLKDMRAMGCEYSSIIGTFLKAYERVGRIDKVPLILNASFYENILFDATPCSILVLAYVKASLMDDALQVLREKKWKDSTFEDNLYHLLICSCKEAGNYENAAMIFTHRPESGTNLNLHIMCSMIDIYGSMGRFGEAEDLYLRLKASGITLDLVAYSIVVRMYVKAGKLKDAYFVLDMVDKQKDIIPDIFLYRDMLRIYQQCGMLDKLADVYYKMLKGGVTWDEAMYNCAINCCARALPVDELSRLFDEMLQHGYLPSTITFNVMMDVYGKAGFLKKARKVFWMARKRGLADVISYNTIIAAYGQSKDFRSMMSVVRRMQYAGYPISLEAYNCMLDAYGKDNQLEEFNDVLHKMKQARCPSDHYTYNIMMNIYGKKGWIEEVAGVLAELRDLGLEPDLYSYNILIKAYGIAGMVEEAVDIVKEMREKGLEPDRVTYTNLIYALQRNEKFLEAVKWSLWMKQMGLSS